MAAEPASAQVFKCKGQGGKIEYQNTPCAGDSTQYNVDLMNDAPSQEDALRAQQRALSNKYKAGALDAERERNRRNAMAAQEQRYAEKEAKDRRCANYQERSKALDDRSDSWYTKRYRDQDRAEAESLRDRHFSECFGQ